MDYKKISQDVVDHVGGISNIKGATHCVTRLRLILNDETKYDRKALENIEGVKVITYLRALKGSEDNSTLPVADQPTSQEVIQ